MTLTFRAAQHARAAGSAAQTLRQSRSDLRGMSTRVCPSAAIGAGGVRRVEIGHARAGGLSRSIRDAARHRSRVRGTSAPICRRRRSSTGALQCAFHRWCWGADPDRAPRAAARATGRASAPITRASAGERCGCGREEARLRTSRARDREPRTPGAASPTTPGLSRPRRARQRVGSVARRAGPWFQP